MSIKETDYTQCLKHNFTKTRRERHFRQRYGIYRNGHCSNGREKFQTE
jgi:hypothetical protein